MLARLRGDDRCIERQKVRAIGDLFDDGENLADLPNAALQLADRGHGAIGQLARQIDPLHHPAHGVAARLGILADVTRDRRRRLRGVAKLGDRGVHLRDKREHFIADMRQQAGALRHLPHRCVHLRSRCRGLLHGLEEVVGAAGDLLRRGLQLEGAARSVIGQPRDGIGGREHAANSAAHVFQRRRGALCQLRLIAGANEKRLCSAGDHAHPLGDRGAASADAAEEAAEIRAGLGEAVGELAHLIVREHSRRHVEVALRHLRCHSTQLADRRGDVAGEEVRREAEDRRRQQRDDERVERDLNGDVAIRPPGNGEHENRSVLQLGEPRDVR